MLITLAFFNLYLTQTEAGDESGNRETRKEKRERSSSLHRTVPFLSRSLKFFSSHFLSTNRKKEGTERRDMPGLLNCIVPWLWSIIWVLFADTVGREVEEGGKWRKEGRRDGGKEGWREVMVILAESYCGFLVRIRCTYVP